LPPTTSCSDVARPLFLISKRWLIDSSAIRQSLL
jgi:hypothetical protein